MVEEACAYVSVCIMIVKGTEEQTASSPCRPLSVSFPSTLWNPTPLVSLPSCQDSSCYKVHPLQHGIQVSKHSFLMFPNESSSEYGGAGGSAPLWPLRKPSISPLPYSKVHLSYLTSIHSSPVSHPLVPMLISFHHGV